MNVFTGLNKVLGNAEAVNFTVRRAKDGKLTVLIVPQLEAAAENLTDEEAQVRAALAVPLRVTETAEALDRSFLALLTEYANQRKEVVDELDALQKVKEAAKNARKAISKAGQAHGAAKKAASDDDSDEAEPPEQEDGEQPSKPQEVKGDAPPPPPARSSVTATNPGSLF